MVKEDAMDTTPLELLRPIFDFLEGLISDYGDVLFIGFAYVAIPFMAWVLSGGLRRLLPRHHRAPPIRPVVGLYLPVGFSHPPPEPPCVGLDTVPPQCDREKECE